MTRKYLTLAAVSTFAVLSAVLVYHGNRPPASAAESAQSAPTSTAGSPATTGSSRAPASSAAAPARAKTNVPMTKLKPGEKAPQFIIFSFDGVGDHDKWSEFLRAADGVNARFTGFLTGTYLLTDANKAKYTGPGHAAGKSSVGFGGTPREVATRLGDLNTAYAAGHEIGTHYNGHFCAGNGPSGNDWSVADWTSELDQFFSMLAKVQQNNPEVKSPKLTVPATSIKGGRTPCLEGKWERLVPAWRKHKFSYDSSMNAPYTGLKWPVKLDGIWEFYMPYVYSAGFGGMVLAMDYNMWIKFNHGKNDPATVPALREKVYETYVGMYDAAYAGNRAPLVIGNHFNTWNGNAFNPSVLKFMQSHCAKPDTYCATYSDVVAWMQLQDPKVLAALQAQPPVADRAP